MSGEEPILGASGVVVGDFWKWAYSDVLGNRNRGILAEFLVGSALGVVGECRTEWDAFDLKYAGRAIEVKASGYIQSWPQKGPSNVRFGIGKRKAWFAETNTYADQTDRSSDIYVFCLHAEIDREQANPLDTAQWVFYAVPTKRLNEQFPDAESIGLSSLQKIANACGIEQLKSVIDQLLNQI